LNHVKLRIRNTYTHFAIPPVSWHSSPFGQSPFRNVINIVQTSVSSDTRKRKHGENTGVTYIQSVYKATIAIGGIMY